MKKSLKLIIIVSIIITVMIIVTFACFGAFIKNSASTENVTIFAEKEITEENTISVLINEDNSDNNVTENVQVNNVISTEKQISVIEENNINNSENIIPKTAKLEETKIIIEPQSQNTNQEIIQISKNSGNIVENNIKTNQELQEFVEENEIINISDCSTEFMDTYFTEVEELNEKINEQTEEKQEEIKSNMLIVTSKEENINSYGANTSIKGPNNQFILVYDNEEQMEQAKENLDNDDKILNVDNNNVYYISEVENVNTDKIEDEGKIELNIQEIKVEQNFNNRIQMENINKNAIKTEIKAESTIQETTTYNSWGIEATGLNTASNIANTKTLNEVTVAILDTGCNIELLEQNYPNKLKGYYDVNENETFTDEVGHGTHIAGTIAEATPNNVKIYPIKVSSSTTIFDSDIIFAINYIVENDLADVINMSFSGYYYNASMYTAISAATSENIICVAAAGNDSVSTNTYPACYDNTISISACDENLEFASYSNFNNAVDFVAPGTNILSINGTASGTSMATPHMASAVAIYKSYNKEFTLNETIEGLKKYAIDLGEEGKDIQFGYGIIDLKNIEYCTCKSTCGTCCEIYCSGCDCENCNCIINDEILLDGIVTNVEIQEPVEVLNYNYGSITNLSNVLVNIEYDDGSIRKGNLFELEDCEIIGYNPYLYEEQIVQLNYKEQITSFKVNVTQSYESGWEYELNADGTVTLTGFKTTEDMENIHLYIPEVLEIEITEEENGESLISTKQVKVTQLGKNLFLGETDIIKVVTTSNITVINDGVFNNCKNLQTVVLSTAVTTIGNNAFYNCTELLEINIPTNVKEIGKNAFYATQIKKAEIPEGVEIINEGTFNSCSSLAEVTLPSTLQTIDTKAFYGCSNIYSISIPGDVTKISADAFGNCNNLSTITVSSLNMVYDSREDCNAVIETATNKLVVGANYTTIPTDVVTIGAYAFQGRLHINILELHEGLTTIESKAFADSKTLLAILIPASVTSIETDAFANSSNVILFVYKISYGRQYAVDNEIPYRYLDVSIVGIYLDGYTEKTYKAFEQVDMDDVIVILKLNDDSEFFITEGYEIIYEQGTDSFRYGDTIFQIYYNKNGFEFIANKDVVVEKATPKYEIPSNLTGKMGQTLSQIDLPEGFEWVDSTQILTELGSISYIAKYTPDDTQNYEIVENIEIPVEVIKPLATEIKEISGITKTEYNAFETVEIENVVLTILYETGITEEKIDGYTVKYQTATDGFRYGDTKFTIKYIEDSVVLEKDIGVTVNKVTPTYTIPTGLTAKRGQKLSSITLPTGFKWMDSSIILSEVGNKVFKVKFIPTDTVNYKTVENIEVKVNVTKENQSIKLAGLTNKNSFVYGFKVKTVDVNNKVISYHKVSDVAKNLTLSKSLIYEIYSVANEKMSANDAITTGCKINIYSVPVSSIKELVKSYIAVIYGDTNCDGLINSGDLLTIKKHLLKTKIISNDAAKEAADINQDGVINSADLFLLKKHLLGKSIIAQNKY